MLWHLGRSPLNLVYSAPPHPQMETLQASSPACLLPKGKLNSEVKTLAQHWAELGHRAPHLNSWLLYQISTLRIPIHLTKCWFQEPRDSQASCVCDNLQNIASVPQRAKSSFVDVHMRGARTHTLFLQLCKALRGKQIPRPTAHCHSWWEWVPRNAMTLSSLESASTCRRGSSIPVSNCDKFLHL